MLKIKPVLVVLLILNFSAVFARNDAILNWNKDYSLQWADFQSPVDQTSPFAANTHSGVSYSWNVKYNNGIPKFTFTAVSFMDRFKSWVRTEKETPELLKHEQIHFDISEFFARKLLEALNNYRYTDNYKNEIAQIYTQMMSARTAMESTYDNQTSHSIIKLKQAQWQNYVEGLLNNNYTYNQAIQSEPAAQ
jgi:hypothetical protein